MSKDTFLEQIQPIPEYDHMYFESADWTLGVNASCRAYFNFIKMVKINAVPEPDTSNLLTRSTGFLFAGGCVHFQREVPRIHLCRRQRQ